MNAFKFSGLLLGATLVLAAGCTPQDDLNFGEKESVTFHTVLPTAMTRAAADGTKVDQLVCYIYDSQGAFVDKVPGNLDNNKTTGSVTLNLVKNVEYKLVFWADHKVEDSANLPYSINQDTGRLTMNYDNMDIAGDTSDAFYLSTTYKTDKSSSEEVILRRPFAQMNFGTDDLTHPMVQKAYSDDVVSAVTLEVYKEMDIRSGEMVGTPASTTIYRHHATRFTYERFPVEQGATQADDKYKYVNMGYVLAPAGSYTTTLYLKTFRPSDTADSQPLWTVEVPYAPLRSNYRTNVFGSLLTSKTDFNVTVTPDFDGEYVVQDVATATKLTEVLNSTGDVSVKLSGDLSKEAFVIPNATSTRTINIDLAGQPAPALSAGENVILNVYDNSKQATPARAARATRATVTGEAPCFHARTGSIINIYGGNYLATVDSNGDSNSCVYSSGGAVNIYDGTFACQKPYNGKWYVLNLKNGSTGTITVYGGRFKDQNPADGDDSGTPGITVADGMAVALVDGWYTITSTSWTGGTSQPEIVGNVYKIRTGDELAWYAQYTYSNSSRGHVVELLNDIDLCNRPWQPIAFSSYDSRVFNGTFNGNGHTIKNLKLAPFGTAKYLGFFARTCWDDPMPAVEIKNVVFDGVTVVSTEGTEFTGCVVGKGKTPIKNVTIKNAKIKGYERLGGIIGECYSPVENCTVDGITIIAEFKMVIDPTTHIPSMDGANGAGGIVGYGPGATVIGCNVRNANITAYRRGGSIVGIGGNDGTLTVQNNTVTNVVIKYIDYGAYKGDKSDLFNTFCGEVGTKLVSGNTATNVTLPENTSGKERGGF